MTNPLGSANPNRIPKSKKSKDLEYINLVRKLHKAERRIQDSVPINLMDVKFEDAGEIPCNAPYETTFESLLPDELSRIEYRRLVKEREDVYYEIFLSLGKEKFLRFFKEYTSLDANDGSYTSTTMFDKSKKFPLLKPAHSIGELVVSGEDSVLIPKDKLPVTFEILDRYPINDGNVRDEAIRVKVNNTELTINYNMFIVIEHIKDNYKDARFHFATLLRDLEIDNIISSDYDGNPNQLFRTRKGLLKILFKDLKSPKGYWLCSIKYWS